MEKAFLTITFGLLLGMMVQSCGKDEGCTNVNATNYDKNADTDDGSCSLPTAVVSDSGLDISILASKFYTSATTVTIGDEFLTITSTDEPDHKSMYYKTTHALYEDYNEPNNPDFKQNPNTIGAQNFTFSIPRYPSEASTKTSTSLGAMGVAINGVVFFNQEAALGDDILDELNTFDQYEGHPANTTYHYHIGCPYLEDTKGNDAFMGFLLDGFPVYGPYENSVKLVNADLDDYHGHTSATTEFPDGIYHYHITSDLPWINGGKYFGTAGTVTQ